jgi:hypothetical protein
MHFTEMSCLTVCPGKTIVAISNIAQDMRHKHFFNFFFLKVMQIIARDFAVKLMIILQYVINHCWQSELRAELWSLDEHVFFCLK